MSEIFGARPKIPRTPSRPTNPSPVPLLDDEEPPSEWFTGFPTDDAATAAEHQVESVPLINTHARNLFADPLRPTRSNPHYVPVSPLRQHRRPRTASHAQAPQRPVAHRRSFRKLLSDSATKLRQALTFPFFRAHRSTTTDIISPVSSLYGADDQSEDKISSRDSLTVSTILSDSDRGTNGRLRATEHPTQPPQDGVPHPVHASTPTAQGPPRVLDPTAPLERHPYPRRRRSLSPAKLVSFFPRLGRHRSCCSVDGITSKRPFPPRAPRTTPPRGTNHDRSGQRIETGHVYRRGNSPASPSNNVFDGPRPLSAVGAGGQGTGGPSLERATQQIPGPRTDDRCEENGGSVEHTSRSQHNIDFLSAISAIVALHSLVTGQHSDRPAHDNTPNTTTITPPVPTTGTELSTANRPEADSAGGRAAIAPSATVAQPTGHHKVHFAATNVGSKETDQETTSSNLTSGYFQRPTLQMDSTATQLNAAQISLATSPLAGADLVGFQNGQRALTMLLQVPTFSGGPSTRFDRWIKQFDNVAINSNWSDSETVSMLLTKMSDKVYDIVQNILESQSQTYKTLKVILHERFHGNETTDYYQKKFDKCDRKPGESVLDFAFRLKTIFLRAYPPNAMESAGETATRSKFLRQKFLQGLETELRSKVRR